MVCKLFMVIAFVASVAVSTQAVKCQMGKNNLMCSGNGLCTKWKAGSDADSTESDSSCYCKPGWRGTACSVKTCKKDCGVHGVCKHKAPKPSCLCDKGWGLDPATGAECAKEVCPGTSADGSTVCSNGQGVCQMGPSRDEVDQDTGKPVQKLVCYCQPGFYGEDCSIPVGTPVDVTDKTRCKMKNNETDEMSEPCEGRGRCIADRLGHYSCSCNDGFTGRFCEQVSCDCQNGGVCNPKTGNCTCSGMYFGKNCHLKRCAEDCSGKGYCNNNTGLCERCKFGYTESSGCKDYVCNNETCDTVGGQCMDNKCVCNPGYTTLGTNGKQCKDLTCKNDCNYNNGNNPQGYCKASGVCQCSTGWKGDDCSVPVVENIVSDVGSPCDEDCPQQCSEEFRDKCNLTRSYFTITWDASRSSSVRNEVPFTTPEKKAVELEDLLIDASNWTLMPTPPNVDQKEVTEARQCYLGCIATCLAPCQKDLMSKNDRQRTETIEKFKPGSLPLLMNMTGHITRDEEADEINKEEFGGKRVIYNKDITEMNHNLSTDGEMESRNHDHIEQPLLQPGSEAPRRTTSPVGQEPVVEGQTATGFKAIGSRLRNVAESSSNRNNVRVEDVEARASAIGAMAGMFP